MEFIVQPSTGAFQAELFPCTVEIRKDESVPYFRASAVITNLIKSPS